MPQPEKPHESRPTVGIAVAVTALVLLIIVMLLRPRPEADLPPDQGPIAMAVVNELMTNGVLVDYDCLKTIAWVNRAVWAKYNREQHRNMVVSLATLCERQRGTYRISILDYESKRELAAFDGKTMAVE